LPPELDAPTLEGVIGILVAAAGELGQSMINSKGYDWRVVL